MIYRPLENYNKCFNIIMSYNLPYGWRNYLDKGRTRVSETEL